jgi:hypothetical protein
MHQKLYKKAKNNFAKMLTIALALNDYENELYAYDYIGLQFYYLGSVEKAHFFHQKMSHGDVEEDDSCIRCIGK